MATIYKFQTGAALATSTNWSLTSATVANAPAAAPGASDLAYWQAGSLGASLTGSISPQGIQVDGALSNIAHSSGTITLGTGGFTFSSTNNRQWTETGTIAIGTNNQTWALSNTTLSSSIVLSGASTLTGSATINITNNSGLSTNNPAYLLVAGANTGFTGTLSFDNFTALAFSGANNLTAGNIQVLGSGVSIYSVNASGDVLGAAARTLTLDNNVSLGVGLSRAFTIASGVSLGATTKTITIRSGDSATFSGSITGTAGFTKAGPGRLTFSNTAGTSTISGTALITATGLSAGASSELFLGTVLSGTPNVLQNVSNFQFSGAASTTYASLTYLGSTAYTEDASFLVTSGTAANSTIWSQNSGGITFAPSTPGGISNFTGAFYGYVDNATTASKQIFNEFPTNSGGLGLYSASTGATAVTVTQTVNVGAGGTTNAPIFITTSTASSTGTVYVLDDTCGAATVYGGAVTKGGGVSSTAVFRLQGTNTNATLSGAITETGGAGTVAMNKQGTGKWTLSGNNSYLGATTVAASSGTLVAASNSALGSSSASTATTVNTGSTLEIAATAVNKASSQVTFGGTGDGGNGAIRSQSGTNTFTAANYVLSANARVRVDADRLTLASAGAVSGAFNVDKTGAGELYLPQTNSTYTGTTTVTTGKLVVSKLANVGAVSSLGQPALANATITLAPGTTLDHEGTTADSTDRIIALNAAGTMTIESSGTSAGAVTLAATGSFTIPNGANLIIFTGTNAADNTCARAIANPGTGTTGITKSGSNKWIFTGALTHTGTTAVSAGTLNLGSTNRSLATPISVSGGTLENGTNTVETSAGITMTGGTITAAITGTTTLTVNSGTTARLEPLNTAKANTFTGNTTINGASKLELVTSVNPASPGTGKVLGNSATTVNGELITSANSTQRGQMRYGGNLTFNSGSVLRIGFAA